MSKKSKKSNLKNTKIWMIAVVVLIVILAPILINQQKILSAKNQELQHVQAKIQSENKVKQVLLRQQSMLNTDAYAEKIAREKFGMIKPGEKIFIDINK